MVDTIIPPKDPQSDQPGNAHLYHGPLLGPGAEDAAAAPAETTPATPVGGSVTLPSNGAAPSEPPAETPGPTLDPSGGAAPPPPPVGTPINTPPPRRRRWIGFVAAAGFAGLVLVGFLFAAKKPSGIGVTPGGIPLDSASQFTSTSVPLDSIPQGSLSIDSSKQLTVNGQLRVNGAFVLTPSGQPANAIAGQLYFDQASNQVYYYNGTAFQNLVNKTDIVSSLGSSLGPGLRVVNSQLTNTGLLSNTGVLSFQGQTGNVTGVTSLQGQNGAVTLTGGGGIAISGTTITNSGVTGLGGQTGQVAVGTGLAAAGGTLSNSGVVTLVTGSPGSLTVANDGLGNYTVSVVASANNVVLGPSSIQTDSSNNPSINYTKTGSGNLVQLAVGASPVNKFVVDQTGAILVGSIDFGQVTGKPTFVNSLGGGTGALLLGTGLQLSGSTINNTGVTQLTGTANQVIVSAGTGNITVSLPQNIGVTSTPTFGGLTLATTALGVSSGGTGINTAPTNGQVLIGNGSGYQLSTLTAGTSVTITNGPGSIQISVPSAGQCTLCADKTLGNLSSVAINQSLLPASAGAIDLGGAALPYKYLFLAGDSSGASTKNFKITGTPTTTRTITLPDADGTVCLASSGSCGFATAGSYVNLQASTPGSAQTGNINITGTLIAGNVQGQVNGLTLSSAGTSQFTIAGGSPSSRTLTVSGDTSVNQNLLMTSSPTFAGLTLSSALTVGNGGTGLQTTPGNGQLPIGNGSGYSLNTLTAGSGINIANASGTITISSPGSGSCSTCADTSLSNLSSVSIPTSANLLPASAAGIDVGSNTRPIKELYIAGTSSTPGTNNFKFTGVATGGTKTFTLDNLNGTGALVQTAGSSVAQTGDINANGTLIAGTAIQGILLKSADSNSTNTANLVIRSGNTSAGNSGNVTLDAGTFSGTGGSVTLGGTSASALTLGRAGLNVSLPGTLNSQTISSAAILTGTLAIQGASALTLGTSSTSTGAVILKNSGGSNTTTLKASDSNPASGITFTLPSAVGSTGQCLEAADSSGGLTFSACSGGLSGSGTAGKITKFTGTSAVGDSILSESGSVITLGSSGDLVIQGGINSGGTSAASLQLGTASSLSGAIAFQNFGDANVATVKAPNSINSSYNFILPTTAPSAGTDGYCLNINQSGQVGYKNCALVSGGGGSGTVTANAGTDNHVLRFTNGASFIAGDSTIQDAGNNRVGINIAASGTTGQVLTVGSSGAFIVTDSGGATAASLTTSGLIQGTANGQALSISGTPTNSATQSLVQIGGAIAGGNTATNGGTYLGLNAPNSGAGTAADFINFQKNGVAKLVVTNAGNFTTAGTYNGVTISGSNSLSVTGASTINQDVSTGGGPTFNSLTLTNKLTPANGGTGTDTSGSLAGSALLYNATTGKFQANRITSSGGSITPTYSDGNLNLEVNSCSTCANTSLSNLSGVSFQGAGATAVSLLTGVAAEDLGSRAASFRNLYIYGSSTYVTDSLKITTTATGNTKVATFPDATGVVCLDSNNCNYQAAGTYVNLQATTPGSAQTGNLNITGASIAGSYNGLTLTAQSTGFNIAGGTTSKTLFLQGDSHINQDLLTTSSGVAFAGLTVNGNTHTTGTTLLDGTLTVTTISPPASTALTVGATGSGQNTTVQGTTLTLKNGADSFTFPSGSSAICTVSSGNCAGSGTGVTTTTGSNHYIAVFNGSQSITVGSLYDDFAGNVGIGTTSPGSNFTVQGTQPGSVSGNGTNATQAVGVTGAKGGNTTGVSGQTGGTGAAVAITAGDGGNAPSGSTNGTGGNITLTAGAAGTGAGSAGAAGKVIIQATGGVGIGTINPGAGDALDVQGGAINASGAIRTGGTDRISSGGNLVNIGTVTTSGAINGQTISNTASFAGTVQAATSFIAPLFQTADATGANSSGLNIRSGNTTTSGNSGNVSIDVGTAAGTTGSISIGTSASSGTTIGRAAVATTINGSASSTILIGSGNTTTVGFSGSATASIVYNFDRAASVGTYTVCTTANLGAACAAPGGNGSYIQNGTSIQTTANFAIQSAAAGSIGAVIRAAASQTADLLDLQNSAGTTNVFAVGSAGATTITNTSTSAFKVQDASGSPKVLLTADTTNLLVKVGNGSNTIASSATGGLFVTDVIEGLNGVKLNSGTITSTSGKLVYSGAARNAKTINLIPEYVGATLNGTGIGTMTSDFCSGSGKRSVNTSVCTVSTDEHNYYNWTTSQGSAQTYTIWVRHQVPSDFSAFSTSTGTLADTSNHSIKIYGWGSNSNNTAQVSFYNAAGTLCGTGTRNAATTNGTWQQIDYATGSDNENSCSVAAGDVVTFKIVMSSNSSDGTTLARIGEIQLSYLSSF